MQEEGTQQTPGPQSVLAPSAEATAPVLLQQIFERSVDRCPAHIAIDIPPSPSRPERQRFTYAEIEASAERLAARLRLFVRGECVVAIVLPRRSHHLFVAQLAVLKAGAAYTCVEPDLPVERTRFILEDCGAAAVLTDADSRSLITGVGFPAARCLDAVAIIDHPGPAPLRRMPPPHWLTPSSLCYVIYTSGTTGWPKGVMIEHRSIVNLMLSDAAYFGLGREDRVGQIASGAYDSSVEEIYLAFAAGATLVLVDDDVARLGPDLVPWLRRERLTMFCPAPTLLRTCPDADPERDLPDLHTLYVGGEELTPDVANRWAPGRRMVNGYGPTECAVVITRAHVRAHQPITIGTVVENNQAWIVDEELQEVPPGEAGELCVSGVNVARGYLNRADLTAEKFVQHPQCGRIYRTGDLVRLDATGAIVYLGRIDAQVQIRGHRVELGAIESHLSECAGVAAAACKFQEDGQGGRLVAYVVAAKGARPRPEDLRQWLGRRLPEYMLPAQYSFVDDLPRTPTSGKIDRRALPELQHDAAEAGPPQRDAVAPRTELEWLVADAVAKHLPGRGHVSVHDDFFHDLGGNSLIAAQVISTLRQDERTAGLTVRDVYEGRTIAALAAKATGQAVPCPEPLHGVGASAPAAAVMGGQGDESRKWKPARIAWGSCVQLGWLFAGGGIVAAATLLVVLRLLPLVLERAGLALPLLALPWLLVWGRALWLPVALGLAVGAKRLLIGRYRPGRHPYMGSFYVRNWLVQRCASLVPWGLLEGTVVKNACLRALGARIGRNVHLHHGVDLRSGAWDLLDIGDDVTVGRDAALKLVTVHEQCLVVGPITLGARSTVETRGTVAAHGVLGAESCLTSMSLLPVGASIPAGETWDGIPAQFRARTPAAPEPTSRERRLGARAHAAALLAVEFLLVPLGQLPFFAVLLGSALVWNLGALDVARWLRAPHALPAATLAIIAGAIVLGVALTLPAPALLIRLLGCVPPGVHSRWGAHCIRVLVKGRILEATGNALNGTLFWPVWLRLAGMRVGRKCEISSIMEVVPELVQIGDESFFADGIYMGAPRFDRGTLLCGHTVLGSNTFMGNHAIVPSGSVLPADILLGVCTVAEPRRIRAGTSWFGHPLFELPRREVVDADRRLTHDPAWYRWVTRVFWELSRSTLPAVPLLLFIAWFERAVRGSQTQGGPQFWLVTLPCLTTVFTAIPPLLVLALKWGLLGRVREGRRWLWSCWCGRWDLLYVAWAEWAHGILSLFEGTVVLVWWLRAMGAHVGKRVVLGSGFAQVVDPDMLHFGDAATVACLFQAHSFEDRVLKIAPVWLGAGCSVASGAVLMYGADIGAGTHVGDNSVVMKHERLLPHRHYLGFPTQLAPPLTAQVEDTPRTRMRREAESLEGAA